MGINIRTMKVYVNTIPGFNAKGSIPGSNFEVVASNYGSVEDDAASFMDVAMGDKIMVAIPQCPPCSPCDPLTHTKTCYHYVFGEGCIDVEFECGPCCTCESWGPPGCRFC